MKFKSDVLALMKTVINIELSHISINYTYANLLGFDRNIINQSTRPYINTNKCTRNNNQKVHQGGTVYGCGSGCGERQGYPYKKDVSVTLST